LLGLGLRRLEDRRIADLGADIITDADNDHRQPEADPPAPGEELALAERRRQQQQDDRREQVAHRDARLREAAPETAAAIGAVFGDEQHRAAPFAAQREALYETKQHQQQRRPIADRREGRQAAHQEGRRTDQDEAELEQRLAADAV